MIEGFKHTKNINNIKHQITRQELSDCVKEKKVQLCDITRNPTKLLQYNNIERNKNVERVMKGNVNQNKTCISIGI